MNKEQKQELEGTQAVSEKEQIQEPETEVSESSSEAPDKKLTGKKQGILIAAAAVILALAVGIGIYNTPANRLSRQLDLGQKYLLEQNYEQAIVEFDKAIAIDPMNLDAYLGKADAYIGLGDYDSAIETLKKGRQAIEEDAAIVDKLAEAYLGKAETYESAGDYDNAIRTLEEGYQETSENTVIKDRLVEDYLITAEKKTKSGAYAESLKDYDRLLELDKGNDKVSKSLGSCLNKYLDILMDEARYDEIRALAAKYKNIASGVDFDKYFKQIEELERIKAENDAFMQKVYDLMAAENYEAMYEVDGSEEAEAMVERMEEDRYVYLPDGNAGQTGTGAGIYKFGEGGYYFYYGDYANGSREKNGVLYMKLGDNEYCLFTGQWGQDAPNGAGTKEIQYHFKTGGGKFSKTQKGNLVNGLWDGKMSAQIQDASGTFDLSFSASRGIPTEDKTEAFLSAGGDVGWLDEEDYIYAYDFHRDGHWVASSCGIGKTVGVVGFADVYN